jgi:hypothetical protein
VAISAASSRSPPTRVWRLQQAERALQPCEGEHPVIAQRRGEFLGGEAVDLVAAVGDEIEHEAERSERLGEPAHLVVAETGRVPVERW